MGHSKTPTSIEDVKTDEEAEAYLNWSSDEYHSNPRHPSSCRMYEEHYGTRCVCEDRAEAELRAKKF